VKPRMGYLYQLRQDSTRINLKKYVDNAAPQRYTKQQVGNEDHRCNLACLVPPLVLHITVTVLGSVFSCGAFSDLPQGSRTHRSRHGWKSGLVPILNYFYFNFNSFAKIMQGK
jgi:hypothetical protein